MNALPIDMDGGAFDVEDTRRDHVSYLNELWGGRYCRADNQRWPCRMTLALAEVERLRVSGGKLADLLQQVMEAASTPGRPMPTFGECEDALIEWRR